MAVNLYMVVFGIFECWSRTENILYLERIRHNELPNWEYYSPSSVLLSFGTAIGSIIFGFMTMKLGRKIPLTYMSILMIVSMKTNQKVF